MLPPPHIPLSPAPPDPVQHPEARQRHAAILADMERRAHGLPTADPHHMALDRLKADRPNLGCATTRELLGELIARVQLGHDDLDYRTVDP